MQNNFHINFEQSLKEAELFANRPHSIDSLDARTQNCSSR